MKNLHWSHIVSFTGALGILTLALYSPHTQSSMSQVSREVASQKEILIEQVQSIASPIQSNVWTSLKPAASATNLLLKRTQGE